MKKKKAVTICTKKTKASRRYIYKINSIGCVMFKSFRHRQRDSERFRMPMISYTYLGSFNSNILRSTTDAFEELSNIDKLNILNNWTSLKPVESILSVSAGLGL